MSSPYRQDMPPQSGYASIRIARSNPRKGFTNLTLLALVGGGIAFGLARYIVAQRAENEIRMARAEERTKYAPVVFDYLVKRSARLTDISTEVLVVSAH